MVLAKCFLSSSNADRPLILLGGGGHAKVVAELADAVGRHLIGVCDPALAAAGVHEWRGMPVLGNDAALEKFSPDTHDLALGMGLVPGSRLRIERFKVLTARGYKFPSLIHPKALVAQAATIGDGTQIMAGAIVQPDCQIGENVIVNTHATLDHDVQIGSHVHIAPGAVLCGGVQVGIETFIGASATLLPLVIVGARCLVAAGSTLARSLADGHSYCPHRNRALNTRRT